MALRGGPTRRVQGNVLGSVLRDLDRRTRSTSRRKPREAVEGPKGERGPRGPAGPSGTADGAADVVETGADGRARWEYPRPFPVAPVITAVAVDPDPDGERTVLAVLEEVEPGYVVLRVYSTRPRRAPGVVTPAVAGVRVHVTACPMPG